MADNSSLQIRGLTCLYFLDLYDKHFKHHLPFLNVDIGNNCHWMLAINQILNQRCLQLHYLPMIIAMFVPFACNEQ